jgi:hypothetical protein
MTLTDLIGPGNRTHDPFVGAIRRIGRCGSRTQCPFAVDQLGQVLGVTQAENVAEFVGQDRLKIFCVIGAQAIATIRLVRVSLAVSSVIGFVPTVPAHAICPPQNAAIKDAEVHPVIFHARSIEIITCASLRHHVVKTFAAHGDVGGICAAGSVDRTKRIRTRAQCTIIRPKCRKTHRLDSAFAVSCSIALLDASDGTDVNLTRSDLDRDPRRPPRDHLEFVSIIREVDRVTRVICVMTDAAIINEAGFSRRCIVDRCDCCIDHSLEVLYREPRAADIVRTGWSAGNIGSIDVDVDALRRTNQLVVEVVEPSRLFKHVAPTSVGTTHATEQPRSALVTKAVVLLPFMGLRMD